MDDYYESAEGQNNIDIFWGNSSVFLNMFKKLDLSRIVELAYGHGRHVPHYIFKADEVILVDAVEKNIIYCRERFYKDNNNKIRYYINNGHDFKDIADDSCSALFTYDAMVHFEMLDVFDYLKETYRILQNGGMALFHHSNNSNDYKVTFSTGIHGRNYMSKELFCHLANRAGLEIVGKPSNMRTTNQKTLHFCRV